MDIRPGNGKINRQTLLLSSPNNQKKYFGDSNSAALSMHPLGMGGNLHKGPPLFRKHAHGYEAIAQGQAACIFAAYILRLF